MDDIGECYTLESGALRKGYPRIDVGGSRSSGKLVSAHRVAWMAINGPIPEGGQILHRCDNRACIRGTHLYLGDNDQNVRDRVMRLRSARKITEEEAAEIRRLYSPFGSNDHYGRGPGTGMSGKDLAVRFKTSPSNISRIVNGKGPGAAR